MRNPGESTKPGRLEDEPEVLRRRSPLMLSWFYRYSRRYVARHFHAVRLSRGRELHPPTEEPLVVVLNHPSWWDPLICFLLTKRLPKRRHCAPIDGLALGGYRFFGRLGFFPIEAGTPRGAAAFLRVSLGILGLPDTALWITAEGRFVDPRERPVSMRPGVAHLARRLRRGAIVPLALEYPFWDERCPEALARFGDPLPCGKESLSVAEWTGRIEKRLEETQDALAEEARRRDPRAFETLLEGKVGVGGIYDCWRRLKARMRGTSFSPEHRSLSSNLPRSGDEGEKP